MVKFALKHFLRTGVCVPATRITRPNKYPPLWASDVRDPARILRTHTGRGNGGGGHGRTTATTTSDDLRRLQRR